MYPVDSLSIRRNDITSLATPNSSLAEISFADAFTFLAERDGWTLVLEPFPTRRTISGDQWREVLKGDSKSMRLDLLASFFDYVVLHDRRLTPELRILRKQYKWNKEDAQIPLDVQFSEWKASLSDLDRVMGLFADGGQPGDWLLLQLIPSLTLEQLVLLDQAKLTVASLSPEQKKIVLSMANAFHSSAVLATQAEMPRMLFDEKVWGESLISVEEMQEGNVRISLVKPEKRELLKLIGQAPKRDVLPNSTTENDGDITSTFSQWAERLPRPVKYKTAQFSPEVADKPVAVVAGSNSVADYYRIWFAIAEMYGLAVDNKEDTGLFRLRRAAASTQSGIFAQARGCLPASFRRAFWIGITTPRGSLSASDNAADGKHTIHNRIDLVPKHLLAYVAKIAQDKVADPKVSKETYSFESRERVGLEPSVDRTRNGWSFPVSALSSEEKGAILSYLTAYVIANSATLLLRVETPPYITRVEELVLSGRPSQSRKGRRQFEIDLRIANGPDEKERSLLSATFNLEIDRYKKTLENQGQPKQNIP